MGALDPQALKVFKSLGVSSHDFGNFSRISLKVIKMTLIVVMLSTCGNFHIPYNPFITQIDNMLWKISGFLTDIIN